MMPLIGESLDFRFYFFKQHFKASIEQFYIFNYAAEGQHEQIINISKHLNTGEKVKLWGVTIVKTLSCTQHIDKMCNNPPMQT